MFIVYARNNSITKFLLKTESEQFAKSYVEKFNNHILKWKEYVKKYEDKGDIPFLDLTKYKDTCYAKRYFKFKGVDGEYPIAEYKLLNT